MFIQKTEGRPAGAYTQSELNLYHEYSNQHSAHLHHVPSQPA